MKRTPPDRAGGVEPETSEPGGPRADRLEQYNARRDFGLTTEPKGRVARMHTDEGGRWFVVQKHDARRLHYDFRLEHDGVLLSWAVPKGPSLSPSDKRLAVQTEDHPLDYRDFEGTIPEGEYGAGPVIVWDRGTWTPLADPTEGLKKGRLDFEVHGEKLHGRFLLVRTRAGGDKPTWLLIKRDDEHVKEGPAADIVSALPRSVLTGRAIEEVRAGVPGVPLERRATKTKRPKRASKAGARQKRARKRADGPASESDAPPHGSVGSQTVEPAKLPPFGSIAPQLATLVKSVPSTGPWLYEIKYDGYRTMAWLEDKTVKMASRRGLDWTDCYAEIADALSRVRARSAIFDGEVAYVLEDGRTDFQKLQNTLGSRSPHERSRLVYFIFDLLHYDGVDLRGEPLSFRKDKLRTILAGEGPPLRMSDDVAAGPAFFREVCKLGLEGIIGKRADRPYRTGRSTDWIKVKCQKRQELIVVGFTPLKGTRSGIGALLLGIREGNRLRYAGKVGTGFSNATLKDLALRLGPLVIDAPPVSNPPRMREVTWVKPELVAQIRFSEWTTDGVLRQPAFEGLRLDKPATEVHRETPQPTPKARGPASIHLVTEREEAEAAHVRAAKARERAKPHVRDVVVSHPSRVIDTDTGLTKLDLVRYAGEIASFMLPFVLRRPLMLVRCPGGTQQFVFRQSDRRAGVKTSCFVQKHSGQGVSAVNLGSSIVPASSVAANDGGGTRHHGETMVADGEEVLFVTNEKHIITLAQQNTIEMHGWGSRLPRWDRPDWIVFDLDPDESLPFSRVIESALELREGLRTLGLASWVKTTGGKGLHLVVPIARRYDWDTVRRVSEHVAVLMAHAAPSRYVATMTKRARIGKVFIDYFRNAEGATAILPYSARARPGLPVALPIAWEDLRAVEPEELTIVTVPKLLARRRTDPWADLLATKQLLPRELLALPAA